VQTNPQIEIKSLHSINKKIHLINEFDKQELIDIYGKEWKSTTRYPILKRLMPFRYKYFNFSDIKGYIKDKLSTHSNYKFTLVIENSDINGYISEKIFDAVLSHSVPMYLGAPNIIEYIPVESFVNVKNFETYNYLIDYLISVSNEEII